MVYAFDASVPATMSYQWRFGCPNLGDDTNCTGGSSAMGQSWSTPAVGFVKGYNSGNDKLVMFGGGYDSCEDSNSTTPACSPTKGNVVFVLDATSGAVLQSFATERAVAADPALVDIDYDGKVDYAYFVDLGGTVYRLDFIDGPVTRTALANGSWTFHTVAYTNGAGRKFHYPPALLPVKTKVYLALGSGDREKPLEVNYPYATPVMNRFYVYLDDLAAMPTAALTQAARALDPLITNLDDASTLEDFTLVDSCGTPSVLPSGTKKGWFIDLAEGRGEQTVTSAVIVGGRVAFSTNFPIPAVAGTCSTPLGEARGYFMNLINASGTICPPLGNCSCGGSRSSKFTGGGLPPSPVITTVNVGGVDRTVCIGCADPKGGDSVAIQPQEIKPPINLKRHPIYWFSSGDN
jgi:Tfp pilus tip-associated adhesin PilY1